MIVNQSEKSSSETSTLIWVSVVAIVVAVGFATLSYKFTKIGAIAVMTYLGFGLG